MTHTEPFTTDSLFKKDMQLCARSVQLFLLTVPGRMEDDVCYSTLVFSTIPPSVPKDVADNETVLYSEIRKKGETSQSRPVDEEVSAPRNKSYRYATAALGLLCVILLAGLTTMCILNINEVSKNNFLLDLYTNQSTAHRVLQADQKTLEAVTKKFKNTLKFITQFLYFPVTNYCRDRHCEPCMKNWFQNGSSCYMFDMTNSWMTWKASQIYCAERGGQLVVIDSREEQEFISQHTSFYYDQYHGYWIGLIKQDDKWTWSSGAELQSKGFWITAPQTSQEKCVLSNPSSANLNNWKVTSCSMYNRFICEMKALVWPNKK